MLRIVKTAQKILFLAGVLLPLKGYAAEITAIDFDGNIIGQVISNGMVIGPDGENIGSVTADSLIVNDRGSVIGGVVPQGIAIGLDNRLLGKIHSDGIVRSLSGKTLGRSLPNGLVLNNDAKIIGEILYPGIIYSPNGEAIGRLTGGGEYTKLEGQHIGFVSANGYAYRKSGEDYVLDGKLMSSKMVVSVDGKFLGSIAPTGQIIDFEGKPVGKIHANGFAYDAQNTIIGSIITTGYAFTQSGNYMGVVGYNGEVKDGDRVVARYRSDGNLVRENGEVVGFAVDISATANDNMGNYLGYLVPNGDVVDGGKTVGHVGAKGFVYGKNGQKIGNLTKTGPVFDSLARLKGQSMKNGKVISLGGGVIGKMSGNLAYSANGTLLGGTVNEMVAFKGNTPMGISDIDANIRDKNGKVRISPFGYVMSADGKVIGSGYSLSAAYGPEGVMYSYINPNGALYRPVKGTVLTESGIVHNDSNFVGEILNPRYALDYNGDLLGKFANSNLILNKSGEIAYKVIPGGYVVAAKDKLSPLTTPMKGFSGNKLIALNTGGDLIGYTDNNGQIIGTNGEIVGRVIYNEYVIDNNKSVTGKLVPFAPVVNDKCAVIGVVDGNGDIIDHHDVISGHILPNGQAVSDVGNYIGYTVSQHGLIDYNGNFVGTLNGAQGKDINNKNIGCVNRQGIIVDEEHHKQYGVILPEPVIDFENRLFAHVLANGKVVDNNDKIIGYMQPDGDVVSASKKELGNVMRYKVAYSNNNEFLGMVDNAGLVKNTGGKIVGKVNFDGSVEFEDETVGYALYDFYMYDENFIVYGYLTKDGTVLSMVGSKLGKMDRGFVVDRRGEVVARGNRDYLVRDASYNVVGELLLNGTVVSRDGKNIGYLKDAGLIFDTDDNEIARATPYQYYIASVQQDEEREKTNYRRVRPVEPDDENAQEKSSVVTSRPHRGHGNRIVGIAIGPDGDILGEIYENGEVWKDNDLVGFARPDGSVVDKNYNQIGTVEDKSRPPVQQGIFMPNAYDHKEKPNVGPGGGHGPGERYDPQRIAALQSMQRIRRSQISVGELPNANPNYNPASFTGYEEDGWGGSQNISTWRVDMSEMILQDKGIPAVLARSVYASEGLSDNIPITAIVERNVFAEEGRNIIIPAGSRVIGQLSGGGDMAGDSGGAVKIGITWTRLIRPDGSQWTLSSAQSADAQGRAGVIGYLDEQLMKRYALPVVSTTLQGLVNIAMARGEGSTTTQNANGTTTTQDARSAAAEDARDEVNDQITKIINDIMKRKEKIRSVAYVPAGTRIIIYPNQDLWLNSIKRDKRRSRVSGGNNGEDAVTFSDGEAGDGGSAEVTYDGSRQSNVRPASAPAPQSRPQPQSTPKYTPPPQPTQPAPSIESSSDGDVPELL